jgi:hypothetical protein
MHGVIGSNPSEVKFFFSCSRHAVILHCAWNYFDKLLYFPKIFCHTSLYGPIASGTSVDPNSQVCLSTMLALPIVEY